MSESAAPLLDPELLEMLRCPDDHSALQLADAETIAALNRRILAGDVTNLAGAAVSEPLSGGLIRAAGDRLYPIVDQIPVMLPDEAILLAARQS